MSVTGPDPEGAHLILASVMFALDLMASVTVLSVITSSATVLALPLYSELYDCTVFLRASERAISASSGHDCLYRRRRRRRQGML